MLEHNFFEDWVARKTAMQIFVVPKVSEDLLCQTHTVHGFDENNLSFSTKSIFIHNETAFLHWPVLLRFSVKVLIVTCTLGTKI